MGVLRESHGVNHATFHGVVGFGRGYRGRRRANGLKRIAQAAGGANPHSLEIFQRRRRGPDAGQIVLRHGRGHEQLGVPTGQVLLHRRMGVNRIGDLHLFFQVANPEKGQFQDRDGGILVAVIAGAELRHFKGANGNTIQIFTVLRKAAIADVQLEFAVGFLLNQLGQLFKIFGERAALTPG